MRRYPAEISIATLLLAGMLPVGCGDDEDASARAETRPFVEIVEAREGTLPLEERVSGVVRAENQVAIRPELSGPIVEVLVRNGDYVRKGDPLVRQDPGLLSERTREASAALDLAQASAAEEAARVGELERRVARLVTLRDEALVSQQELEGAESQLAAARAAAAQARARIAQAEASLAEARRAREQTILRAPISGTVGSREAEVGMMAGPGDVLFVIGDLAELIVEVPLTEEMLGYVEEGQRVRILSPRLEGGSIDGILARISPFLRAGSFSTVGEIDVVNPEGRLQPGMFVQVDLLYGESERATLIPTSGLWEDPETGRMTAWVVEGGPRTTDGGATATVVRRDIEVVGEGRLAAAVRGVREGEQVVVLGQHMFDEARGEARLRSVSWERVAELQGLQREDLLAGYLERQQRLAQLIGARPLDNEEFLGSGVPIDPEKPVSGEGL